MPETARCELSVVVELTTADITGACDARRNLLSWIHEAEQAAPVRSEIVVVGPEAVKGLDELGGRVPLRGVVVAEAGYYALKNAGAAAARGEILFFTDADCRPSPGYLKTLVTAFEDQGVAGVAGRSRYDGQGFLTRLNSVHSFGELHCGQQALDAGMVLTHGVAFRRSVVGAEPFGPFAGRVGGDRYLTDRLRGLGHDWRLVEDLLIWHEDISYSLRGTVERHLRECFVPVGYGTPRQRLSYAFTLACTLLLRPALRARRLLRAGPRLGITPLHYPAAAVLQFGYWLFDLACVSVVLAVPPVRRRWLRFQFGAAVA